MSDVYLKAWHGGLGDALQFSTLPEEFEKQQGRKTYIVADAPFRNEGIYDLVWDKNPYVYGKKFGEWNAGDIPSIPYREDGFLEKNGTGNMILNWEKFHGLQPTNKYPKIYYEPEKDKGVNDLFIVDFTSTTVSDNPTKLSQVLENENIIANCLHPGVVGTGFGQNNGIFSKILFNLSKPFMRSSEKGAETSIYLCSSPDAVSYTHLTLPTKRIV